MMMKQTATIFLIVLLSIPILTFSNVQANSEQFTLLHGVWNNFDFTKPAQDWANAAHNYEGENKGIVDIVVAQASKEGLVMLPFPFQDSGYGLTSYSEVDLLEPYLTEFDSDNISVLLSIQPLNSDVTQLIDILLERYGHHSCLIGINVDMEWKMTGNPYHVNDNERDKWLTEIAHQNSNLKLVLTYFKDYRYFPNDKANLVVLFDGTGDSQSVLLNLYSELAEHFSSVGIYTGYSLSSPPTASDQRIIDAVPKTNYIIHTEDVFSEKTTLIFEMDDIEAGWNIYTAMSLADLHLKKNMPLLCGVAPAGLDDTSAPQYLPSYLKDLNNNYFDTFEIAQLGYGNNDSEALQGKSYEEQKTIIENGLRVLNQLGIQPKTFIPPVGSADRTTLQIAEELGFQSFVDLYENMTSDNLLVLSSYVSLMDPTSHILKQPEQLMADIDNMTNQNPIIIQYQVADFANNTKTRLNRLSTIIDTLRSSEKYLFMTADQYLESVNAHYTPIPIESTPTFLPWALYVGVISIALTIILTVSLTFRKRRSKRESNQQRPKQKFLPPFVYKLLDFV